MAFATPAHSPCSVVCSRWMIGLVAYSPTLDQIFCAVTGYGGTVQRAVELTTAQAQAAATDEEVAPAQRNVTVDFDSNVAPGLDWEFRPEQRKVETVFGAARTAVW